MERTPIVKIKMSRPYAAYRAGEVVEVTEDFAARLLAWGYAVKETQQVLEAAAIEPRAETANLTIRRKKK
jgi:hypothetical protein